MVADGADGLRQVELTNAAYLSAHRHRPVPLPVSAAAVERCLDVSARGGERSGPDLRRAAARDLRALARSGADRGGETA
jgi:hypothetical protein